jgi:hypothetical protein
MEKLRFQAILAVSAWVMALGAGCAGSSTDDGDGDIAVPGSEPWDAEAIVSCESDADCGSGEACEEGVCVMARCMDDYASTPPLGTTHFFGTEGELAIMSDQTWLDAFDGNGDYLSSFDASAFGSILDVVSGNLTGTAPLALAIAVEGQNEVVLAAEDGPESVDMGLDPLGLASGDVDGDDVDELVGLSGTGEVAVCRVTEQTCTLYGFDGAVGESVTMADVDGDGFDEPVLALVSEGQRLLVAWNLDAEETGQDEIVAWEVNVALTALDSGDVDGDGVAELLLLEDGGYWGWAKDRVHVFSPASGQIVASRKVDSGSIDLAVGDRNADGTAEIALLRGDKQLELLALDEGAIASLATWPVTVGDQPQRLAIVDWDGDSPAGRLVSGPELVAGEAVPLAALMFPPYPEGRVAGALGASVALGDSETSGESHSDTLSLSVGLGVSFGAEAFGFKAKVGASLKKKTSVTKTLSKSISVGARYSARADTDLFGHDYAPIVMSCGCYHRYRYETLDPQALVGGDGQTVDIFVPVGGQAQLWSSHRYNAMAKATGKLPEVKIPVRLGDPASYPTAPVTLGGDPVSQDDMVFLEMPEYQASDVGYVEFWLKKGQTQTNSVAESTTLGVQTSFGAPGVSVDANIDLGVAQGYSLKVGKENLFAGGIPPIPDDPETPEDEFALHRFSFSPYVYREHYESADGEDAAFYVLNYTVQR